MTPVRRYHYLITIPIRFRAVNIFLLRNELCNYQWLRSFGLRFFCSCQSCLHTNLYLVLTAWAGTSCHVANAFMYHLLKGKKGKQSGLATDKRPAAGRKKCGRTTRWAKFRVNHSQHKNSGTETWSCCGRLDDREVSHRTDWTRWRSQNWQIIFRLTFLGRLRPSAI